MAIMGFDLLSGLSSIVIITIVLAADMLKVRDRSFPGLMMGKAWNSLSSLYSFFRIRPFKDPFLHQRFPEIQKSIYLSESFFAAKSVRVSRWTVHRVSMALHCDPVVSVFA